jgi:hypothetical protein
MGGEIKGCEEGGLPQKGYIGVVGNNIIKHGVT